MRAARFLAALLLVPTGCAVRPEAPVSVATATSLPEVDWSKAERIDVALSEFSFTPSRLVLEHGRPYRLHLENHGSGGHDFDAPDLFRSSRLGTGTAAGLERDGGTIELARGDARDVYVMPTRAGAFPLDCSHLLHATIFGMTGVIEVR